MSSTCSPDPLRIDKATFQRAVSLARLIPPHAFKTWSSAAEQHPAMKLLAGAFNTGRIEDQRKPFSGEAAFCDAWARMPDTNRYLLVQNGTKPISLPREQLPSWPHAWAVVGDDDDSERLLLHFFLTQEHPLWARMISGQQQHVATNVCGMAFAAWQSRHEDDYARNGLDALIIAGRIAPERTILVPLEEKAEAS